MASCACGSIANLFHSKLGLDHRAWLDLLIEICCQCHQAAVLRAWESRVRFVLASAGLKNDLESDQCGGVARRALLAGVGGLAIVGMVSELR